MKIYEVVDEGVLSKSLTGLGKLSMPWEKTKDVAALAPSASTKIGAMKLAAREAEYLSKIPFFGKTLKSMKIKDAAKKFELARANQAAAAVNNLGSHVSNLIQGLGIGYAVLDYYAAATVIEESSLKQEEKEQKLQELRGILVLKVIGAGVVAKAGQLGRLFTGVLPGMAKLVPGATVGKSAIAAREVINGLIRVGQAGLVGVLVSEKGTQLITDWISEVIINGLGWSIGKFIELLDWIWAAVKWGAGYRAPDSDKEKGSGGAGSGPASGSGGDSSEPSGGGGMGDIASALMKGGDIDSIAGSLAGKAMGLN